MNTQRVAAWVSCCLWYTGRDEDLAAAWERCLAVGAVKVLFPLFGSVLSGSLQLVAACWWFVYVVLFM